MAEKKRLSSHRHSSPVIERVPADRSQGAPRTEPPSRYDRRAIGVGCLSAVIVYVAYFPSDSVAVEHGDALWFVALAIMVAMLGWIPARRESVAPWLEHGAGGGGPSQERVATRSQKWASLGADIIPALIAVWMMVAAVATSPPGNLRMATNEAWFWVAWAVIFPAVRRLLSDARSQAAVLGLLVVCAAGLAAHAMHQQFVGLPRSLAEFRRDPEQVLRLAGIDALPGSAEWMVFENRLLDGGPTATFALANSLAGVLLVGALIALAAVVYGWRRLTLPQRSGWMAALLLCGVGLVATRSRSGLAAVLLGAMLTLLIGWRLRRRPASGLLLGVAMVVVVALSGGLGIVIFGDPEWVEQAPTSLEYRFQYWRSTLAMAVDRPLFAAGPGNFQSIYERYREPSAHEQIADPHHFLFETLAAGGFVGLGLLLVWLGAIAALACQRMPDSQRRQSDSQGSPSIGTFEPASRDKGPASRDKGPASRDKGAEDNATSTPLRAVVRGGLGMLLLVWVISAAVGQLPDWEAQVIAVPVALLIGLLVLPERPGSWLKNHVKVSESFSSVASPAALLALLVHLSVSGGWTVPGVAMFAWVLAATVAGPPVAGVSVAGVFSSLFQRDRRWVRHGKRAASLAGQTGQPALRGMLGWVSAGTVTGLILLGCLYFVSVRPTQHKELAMARAETAHQSGRLAASQLHLREALRADPWAADAALWMADSLRWQLVQGADLPEIRSRWEAAMEEVIRRSGDDPAMFRRLGEQRIHLFQRHGRKKDLDAAYELFSTAARWSPSHQWLVAQTAVIAGALGEDDEADELAVKAAWLAGLGENIARALERQFVSRAEPLGRAVASGPDRRPASELLADRLLNQVDKSFVPTDNHRFAHEGAGP